MKPRTVRPFGLDQALTTVCFTAQPYDHRYWRGYGKDGRNSKFGCSTSNGLVTGKLIARAVILISARAWFVITEWARSTYNIYIYEVMTDYSQSWWWLKAAAWGSCCQILCPTMHVFIFLVYLWLVMRWWGAKPLVCIYLIKVAHY
jgi:hypothetical protein